MLSYRPATAKMATSSSWPVPGQAGRREAPAKTVIFGLHRSGPCRQEDRAGTQILCSLPKPPRRRHVNIVAYDDHVGTYKPELRATLRSRRRRSVSDNIREGGSTNIDSALKTALGMIQDDSRPSYVLFMTDGLPTAGQTNELAIAENCRTANSKRARLFAFGVGFDVNARLLDRLSGGNSGTSEYVRPDEDIESHVSRFYAKMTSPVLSNIRVELTGTDVNRTYPRDVPDLFEGQPSG